MSVDALKRLHAFKRSLTSGKINAALDRMATGRPAVLKIGFQWSKRSLAAEARIHVNTLSGKARSGAFTYQVALNRLRELERKSRKDQGKMQLSAKDVLKRRLSDCCDDRTKLLKQLKVLEWQLLDERESRLSATRDKEALLKRLVDAGLAS